MFFQYYDVALLCGSVLYACTSITFYSFLSSPSCTTHISLFSVCDVFLPLGTFFFMSNMAFIFGLYLLKCDVLLAFGAFAVRNIFSTFGLVLL